MFQNALRMARSSAKLIFRSKAFIFVCIVIPLFSTLMMNLWYTEPPKTGEEQIYELSSINEQMAYHIDFYRFPVKIFDTVGNEKSKKICQALNNAGMFQIFRADAASCGAEELEESMKTSAMEDRVSAIVVLRDTKEETEVYSVGDDTRFALLTETLGRIMSNDAIPEKAPDVTLVSVSGEEVDYYGSRNFAYCLAIASLGFIFSGVLILNTIVSEKKDKVFNRILMTKANRGSYLLSKIILTVGIALMQSLVMLVGFRFLVNVDIGINSLQFFTCCFLMDLVFAMFALAIGLFCNSISVAVLVAFTVWSVSDLIAGTYFDIADAGDLFRKLSLLMPQRWALFSVTRFIHDDASGYTLLFCAAAAYLVIMFITSVLGLKLSEQD